MNKVDCFFIDEKNKNFELVKKEVNLRDLQGGQVLVKISFSSINYRDTLAYKGNLGVARRFPFAPGVDISGDIIKSADARYALGASVCAMAINPSRIYPGAWANYAIFWGDDLICIKPDEKKKASIIGTAGLAAASGMSFILDHIVKSQGSEILITGCAGGVGVIATLISKEYGLEVTSLIREKSIEKKRQLFEIGVSKIIDSEEFLKNNKMNMLGEEYNAVFDVLGGQYFSTAVKKTKVNGVIASAGLVESQSLSDLTLLPFIIRGLALIGTGAEQLSGTRKDKSLGMVSKLLKNQKLYNCYSEISSEDLISFFDNGRVNNNIGRVIINFSEDV
jgi:putative YhdH/YhfP family quinone oxidoreductase